MYQESDVKLTGKVLLRRLLIALGILVVPNIPAFVLVYTARNMVLSFLLSFLGFAAMIFFWGFYISPVIAYYRFVRDMNEGRSHEFTGRLMRYESDSLREGIPCKTMYFEENEQERLCYFDLYKYPQQDFEEGKLYSVTVHGQSILAMEPQAE